MSSLQGQCSYHSRVSSAAAHPCMAIAYQAIIDDIEKTVWSKSPRINVGNIKRIFKLVIL